MRKETRRFETIVLLLLISITQGMAMVPQILIVLLLFLFITGFHKTLERMDDE